MELLICISCSPQTTEAKQAINYCKLSAIEHKLSAQLFFFGKGVKCLQENFELWKTILTKSTMNAVVCSQSLEYFGEAALRSSLLKQSNIGIAGLGVLVDKSLNASHIINFSNTLYDPLFKEKSLEDNLPFRELIENKPNPQQRTLNESIRKDVIYLISTLLNPLEDLESFKRAIDSLQVFLAFDQKPRLIINQLNLRYLQNNYKALEMAYDFGLRQIDYFKNPILCRVKDGSDSKQETTILENNTITLGNKKIININLITEQELMTIRSSCKYITYN